MLTWLLMVHGGDVEKKPWTSMEAVIKQCEQTKMASDATSDKWFHRKCIYMDREVDLQLGRSDDP